jgi:serine/threonine protein kinase
MSTSQRRKEGKQRQATGRTTVSRTEQYDSSLPPSLDHDVRIVATPHQFQAHYTEGPELGRGAFAEVFLGIHKVSKQEYAIKKIDRAKMIWGDRDALADEINSLIYSRKGPNIVQLYEVYEEQHHCFLVMELMRGGELFDRILDKKNFTEKEARDSLRGMLKGLEYMHEKRVAHRDLKPENLLLMNDDEASIKLADFGFAKRVRNPQGLRTLCGTPGYLAPEILERFPAYDTACDLWSVGVILFLLLGGYLPFEDDDEDIVFERTRNGEYDFHPAYWRNISTCAKTMVTKLLTVNWKKRFTAKDALNNDWMSLANDTVDKNVIGIDQSKENVTKEKKKLKATAKTKTDEDRMKDLNDNFAGFLERNENGQSRLTKSNTTGPRTSSKRFEEDSKSGRPFADFWTLGETLGEGGYACVFRARHIRSGDIYAVKDIDTAALEKNSRNALKDEIAAMKLLRGGPHIIRLLDVFEEPDHTFMVMEECRGGDLLTRITEKEVYTERECRKTCKILFQAMDYIHKKKGKNFFHRRYLFVKKYPSLTMLVYSVRTSVAHRDIKPENVLMVEPDDDHSIKICDFGFAKRVTKPLCLRTLCGTAQYVAPEVLDLQSAGYDFRADMWSVGVVVYILLGGYAPFEGPVQELARAICKGDYYFHDKYWAEISEFAKDMISSLLQVDCHKRLSAEEALQCPWMTIDEEMLIVTDLSKAQAELQKRKVEQPEAHPANKYESLDKQFTAGLGSSEEVEDRMAARTNVVSNDLSEIAECGFYEDSSSGKVFEILYTIDKLIEEGEFAVTTEVRHRYSREVFLVKKVERNTLDTSDAVALQDEISALQALNGSPFIVQLQDIFDETDFTYIVMERLGGGTLLSRINEKVCYSENEARNVVRRVLYGLEHCHNRRIANRNIKCENLILARAGNDTDVKICDFGFAKRALYPNSLVTLCGTEGYVAPEILEHRPTYDVQCDMWSLGVVLFLLLGGYRPFRGENYDIIRASRYGEYKFRRCYWGHISDEAKTLVTRMLTVNPLGRITATAALQSDWMLMTTEEDKKEFAHDGKLKFKAAVKAIIAVHKLGANVGITE